MIPPVVEQGRDSSGCDLSANSPETGVGLRSSLIKSSRINKQTHKLAPAFTEGTISTLNK